MKTLESFFREAEVVEPEPARTETVSQAEAPAAAAPSPSHGGLVVEEVEMKGFMRYLRRTEPPLTFPQPFTAITGLTGAGKTSILDAVTFALYKRTTRTDVRTVKISEVCRNGGYVRVAFRQGGAGYQVKRGIAANGQSYLEVTRDGQPLRGTIPELEALIQDIVGLDYDGFRNSTFVRQEEMKQLGADSPSQRLEIFQKLFRLETFERAAERAKERGDAVRARVQKAEGQLTVLREQVGELPAKEEEAAELEARVTAQRRSLQEAEERLAAQEEALRTLAEEHEAFLRSRAGLEEHERTLRELGKRLEERREALESLPALRERTEALTAEVGTLRQEEEALRGLQEQEQRHALAAQEAESLRERTEELQAAYRRQMEDLERKVAAEEARLAALGTDLGVEEAFATLRQEGALEERLRRISQEVEWLREQEELVRRLEAEREEARETLEEVRTRTAGITADTFLFSEIQERIQELGADLARTEGEWGARLRELGAKLEEAEARRDAVGFGPEERERLRQLEDRVAHLRTAEETLDLARQELQRLQDLEVRVGELEEEQRELEARVAEEREALGQGEEREREYQEARRQTQALREERDTASQVLYEAEARRKAVAERVRELGAQARRLEEVEGRLKELRRQAEVYEVLREGVFHRKGVVMYAVNRLLPELEIETTRNLDDLTDGRLRRVKLETHEEGGGYGIRILVQGVDGEWHDVAVFSGGERTQINAALRFAIAKELASMPQVGRTYGRMKTLFIDEGDLGSLDTERSRELFVAKLFKMGAFFEKVILITHLGEVAERFPGRVRVTMTPQGESRAEVVA